MDLHQSEATFLFPHFIWNWEMDTADLQENDGENVVEIEAT